MKKRWLSAALCTAMVAGSLAGCGLKSPDTATTAAATEAAKEEATTAADAKEETKEEAKAEAGEPVGPAVTLVMAEVNPLDTIVGQTDTAFKEKVEELSGGSITVDLQASGVLGSENDVLDTMLGGGGCGGGKPQRGGVAECRLLAGKRLGQGLQGAGLRLSGRSGRCGRTGRGAHRRAEPLR